LPFHLNPASQYIRGEAKLRAGSTAPPSTSVVSRSRAPQGESAYLI
jgi:hypothetical protein